MDKRINKIIIFMSINVMNYIIKPLCQQTFVFYFFWLRYYDWWCRKYKSKQNMVTILMALIVRLVSQSVQEAGNFDTA